MFIMNHHSFIPKRTVNKVLKGVSATFYHDRLYLFLKESGHQMFQKMLSFCFNESKMTFLHFFHRVENKRFRFSIKNIKIRRNFQIKIDKNPDWVFPRDLTHRKAGIIVQSSVGSH